MIDLIVLSVVDMIVENEDFTETNSSFISRKRPETHRKGIVLTCHLASIKLI